MDDDVKKLQEAMSSVHGHLQDLHHGQKATSQELGRALGTMGDMQGSIQELQTTVGSLQRSVSSLQGSVKNLQARSISMEASMGALGGTFAGIERMLSSWPTTSG